jgi:hypothetical protein
VYFPICIISRLHFFAFLRNSHVTLQPLSLSLTQPAAALA